jgi:hypothetical protein
MRDTLVRQTPEEVTHSGRPTTGALILFCVGGLAGLIPILMFSGLANTNLPSSVCSDEGGG